MKGEKIEAEDIEFEHEAKKVHEALDLEDERVKELIDQLKENKIRRISKDLELAITIGDTYEEQLFLIFNIGKAVGKINSKRDFLEEVFG